MQDRPYLEISVYLHSGKSAQEECQRLGCYFCDAGIPHRDTNLFAAAPLVVTAPTHVKRRSQSDQYHYRIQKKWDARFEAGGDPRPSEIRSVMALPLSGQRPYCKITV